MITIEIIDGILHQWDMNRKIKIVSPDEVVSEIHFSLSGDKTALVVTPNKTDGVITADIPNIFLQSEAGIEVYIVNCSDDVERTIGHRHLYVNERPKPDDYVYTETEVFTYKNLEERIAYLEKYGTSGGGSPARIAYATLLSSAWEGDENLYSQVVTIEGVTKNTQVDLTPSVEQLVIFYNKDLTFTTENRSGVIIVYALGQKPQNDYTIQVTLTEVLR